MIDCKKCTKIEKFEKEVGRLHPAYIPKVCLECLVNEINKLKPVDISRIESEIRSLKAKLSELEGKIKKTSSTTE